MNKIVQGTKNWRPIVTAISFSGKDDNPDKILHIAERIASYKGLLNLNIISKNTKANVEFEAKLHKIPTSIVVSNNFTVSILSLIQASNLT